MDNREQVLHYIKESKTKGKKIVFTNGCFDVIHAGHVLYLADAKAQGDILVVGLNSDSSVKRLKGDSRPIIPASERKIVLENLKSVDYVIVFEEDTPYELISEIKPDVLVKGGDWQIKDIVGHDVVLSNGGIVKSLLFVNGLSTTNIIEKIRKNIN